MAAKIVHTSVLAHFFSMKTRHVSILSKTFKYLFVLLNSIYVSPDTTEDCEMIENNKKMNEKSDQTNSTESD